MKPSQLREWMRRYGNWGVLAVGGYLLLRSLRIRRLFSLQAERWSVLLLLGIGSLLIVHWPRKAPPPRPFASHTGVEKPIQRRPEWEPRLEMVRRHLTEAEQVIHVSNTISQGELASS